MAYPQKMFAAYYLSLSMIHHYEQYTIINVYWLLIVKPSLTILLLTIPFLIIDGY